MKHMTGVIGASRDRFTKSKDPPRSAPKPEFQDPSSFKTGFPTFELHMGFLLMGLDRDYMGPYKGFLGILRTP